MLNVWNGLNYLIYRGLGSSRKLGGAAEHLIDGSEKRVCRWALNFSPHGFEGAVTVFSVFCYLHCTIRVINSGHRNTHRPLSSSPESPHNKLLSCEVRIFLWSGYIKQSEFIDRGCTVLKVDTMLSIFYLAFKAFIKLYRFVHCDIYNSDGTTLKSVLSPSGYLCTRACGKLEVGN